MAEKSVSDLLGNISTDENMKNCMIRVVFYRSDAYSSELPTYCSL